MKILRFTKLFFGIILATLLFASCENDFSSKEKYEGAIRINKEEAKLNVGDKLNLKLSFLSGLIDKEDITWTSENTQVATIEVNSDKTIIVNGVSVGTSKITVTVEGTDVKDTCLITVDEAGIIKILAIGNSFSEDAIENYLYDLAKEAGKKVIIGNLYVGGCSLETHLNNANTNNAAYSYRKVDKNGNKTTTDAYSIAKGLADENWDYISMQQVSQNSGQLATYEASLPGLYKYVKEKSSNVNAKYLLHQTWAYQQNSTHDGFANYGKDQTKMYNAIVETVKDAANLVNIDMVVPAGTAIQNGRTSVIGDAFCRDGYHLNEQYGRFTAACTWYEQIFDLDVTTNTYVPTSLSAFNAKIAKAAAHAAVLEPNKVTDLVDFKLPEPSELKAPIYINFNKSLDLGTFQSLAFGEGSNIIDLIDGEKNPTGAIIKLTKNFLGANDLGVAATTIDWIIGNISQYAFYGDNGKPTSELTVSNLLSDKAYSFTFFGSRKEATDNRETAYKVIGATEETVYLDASSNSSKTISTTGVKPNADGIIRIEVSAGPNNNNGSKYFYLNAMRISPAN